MGAGARGSSNAPSNESSAEEFTEGVEYGSVTVFGGAEFPDAMDRFDSARVKPSPAKSSSSSSSPKLILETFAIIEFCHKGTGSESSTQSIQTATADFSRSVPGTRGDLNRK